MFKNAPLGWTINLVKQVYSNDLIKLFEDTLDLDGEEKIYTRAIRRNYSTIVRPHICSYHPAVRGDFAFQAIYIINGYCCLSDLSLLSSSPLFFIYLLTTIAATARTMPAIILRPMPIIFSYVKHYSI